MPKDCEGPGKRKAEKGNKFVRKKLKKEKIPNVHLKTATIDSGSDGSDEIMGGYYTD